MFFVNKPPQPGIARKRFFQRRRKSRIVFYAGGHIAGNSRRPERGIKTRRESRTARLGRKALYRAEKEKYERK
jgi:hypothetical protein